MQLFYRVIISMVLELLVGKKAQESRLFFYPLIFLGKEKNPSSRLVDESSYKP